MSESKKVEEFNVVVAGVGGQGILTLAGIISEAAMKEGYDVKMSELHGLSQRGGSVPAQVRFGKKIYSSLIKPGHADLVIAFEPVEALRAAKFASKGKTNFVINTHKVKPVSVTILDEKYPSLDEIKNELKEFSNKMVNVDATERAIEETGKAVTSNIYLLGLAKSKGLLPIGEDAILDAIKDNVPEKYFDLNKQVFKAAKE